jgi:sulfotransferase
MVEKMFFQSSLPRAGSTLLQNLIGQNPDFYVTPTSGVLELVFAARANYTDSSEFKAQDQDLMREGFRSFCHHGVEGFFNAITDKKYVMDKSRGWGYYRDFLDFFYPNPKIVCMIRDPRAIFASMEKNHRKNPEKSSHLVNESQMQNITVEQRIDNWVANPPVGLAFERLRQIIREGNDKKILFVKYEDLMKFPDKEMAKIYGYLGVDNFEHDFTDIQQITKEDDSVYGVYGDHVIKPFLSPVKPDWNEVLGKNAAEWVKTHYKWFYEYFNYV